MTNKNNEEIIKSLSRFLLYHSNILISHYGENSIEDDYNTVAKDIYSKILELQRTEKLEALDGR